jgi:hypothetical protein
MQKNRMKKAIIYMVSLGEILLCFSCKQKDIFPDNMVLSVNINQRDRISVFDLFDRIELIPLETAENSLLTEVEKVICRDSIYYIYDRKQNILLRFDWDGRFINQISRLGNGPEEYSSIIDFDVNEEKQSVQILSPAGTMYSFDYAGKLIEKYSLERIALNYHHFTHAGKDQILFWSFISRDASMNQLYLYSEKKKKFIGEYYKDDVILNLFAKNVFYSCNETPFFYKPFYNEVYSLENDSLKVNYKWDFGNETMHIQTYDLPDHFDHFKLLDMLKKSEIPYFFNEQAQNDLYYYTQVIFEVSQTVHVFYNKKEQAGIVFEKFAEELLFNPVYWCDDYVLGLSGSFYTPDKLLNTGMLDETGHQRLLNIKEDDNPCLIKYCFKRPLRNEK